MTEIVEQRVSLSRGTVTVVLKDEFGVLSMHTVAIDQTNGKSLEDLTAEFIAEREDRVTKMLPQLEKLSPDHAQMVQNIRHIRETKDAGTTGEN